MTPAVSFRPLRMDRETAKAHLKAVPDGERLLPLVFDDNNGFYEFDGCGWWTNGYLAVGIPGLAVAPGSLTIQERPESQAFEITLAGLLEHLPGADPSARPCARCAGSGEYPCNACDGTGACFCSRCESEHDCAKCDGAGSSRCKCVVHPLFREPVETLIVEAPSGEMWLDSLLLRHGLQVFYPIATLSFQVAFGGIALFVYASTGERLLIAKRLPDEDRAGIPRLVLKDGRAAWAPAIATEA